MKRNDLKYQSGNMNIGRNAIAIAVAALIAGSIATVQADTSATWTPSGGALGPTYNWNDATNWTPNFNYPNNGGGITYDVTMTNTTQALLDATSATVGQLNMAAGTSIQLYNSSSGAYGLTIDPSSMATPAGSTIAGNIFGNNQINGSVALNIGKGNTSSVVTTITGSLTGNLLLIVNQPTGTVALSGANTYTGATTVSSGTLALSGPGTVVDSSGVTVDTGAVFSVGSYSGTAKVETIAGSGTVTLGSNTLQINNANSTFSGVISGTGLVALVNGNETFSGNNTYSGGTRLDGGTLSISSDSNLGASTGGIEFNGGTLETTVKVDTNRSIIVDSTNGTINTDGISETFAGSLTGTGTLTVTGGGSLAEDYGAISSSVGFEITGNSLLYMETPRSNAISFVGNTGSRGQLQFGLNGHTDVIGSVSILDTSAATNNVIDGGGAATSITGGLSNADANAALTLKDGTFLLNGNNGGFTAGLLKIATTAEFLSTSGSLGSGATMELAGGTIRNSSGAALIFANGIMAGTGGGTIDGGSQNVKLNGTITNTSSSLTLQDGVIALDSTGNATGFTGGTLQVGNGSGTSVAQFTAAGNLPAAGVGITLNQGTLDYTGTGTVSLANAITVTGSGTTGVLENSSSGMETLTGSISNATAGNILAFSGGTFNLNEAGSGSGTFEIGDAPSTVIVSNPNAFGSGAIIVNTGSTLETSDAVLGAGPVMTVTAGSFTENAGGTLKLLATGNGVNDSIALGGGAASLNGELNLIFSGFTPASGQHYTVISTTGTVSGNFSSIVLTGAPSLMIGTGSAVAGTGEEITLSYSAFFTGLSGLTPNQASIAAYLNDNAVLPGVPSVIVNALGTISALPQNLQAQYLDELTPQAYSQLPQQSIQNNTFMAQQLFSQVQNAFDGGGFNTSGLMMLKTNDQDPFAVSMDSALASAQQQAKNSVAYMDNAPQLVGMPGVGPILPAQESALGNLSGFVLGTITVDQLQQNNTPTQNFTTGSVMAGLDYRLNRNLVVGGLFNWAYTGGTLDNVGSRQRSSSYTPGVFVGYKQGGFYADALMAYTYNSYQINRTVNMPGSSSIATGEPDSNEYDANALVGYYLPLARGFRAGPAAGVGFTQINMSGYSETGSPFDLTVAKQHADSLRSLLGMQAQYSFAPENNPLPISINFNAFWQHEFLDSARNINASFTQLGGGSFIFTTAGPSRDSALLGLGASGYIGKQVSLFVNYETQVGDHRQFAQSVMAGVAVSF